MNDGRKLHFEYLVDMTEGGASIQDEFIGVSDLCDPGWFGRRIIPV